MTGFFFFSFFFFLFKTEDCNKCAMFCVSKSGMLNMFHILKETRYEFADLQTAHKTSLKVKVCFESSSVGLQLKFSSKLLREIAWLSVLYSVFNQSSKTPCTKIKDLKTLITVYSTCFCECLNTDESKISPLSNVIFTEPLSLSRRRIRI